MRQVLPSVSFCNVRTVNETYDLPVSTVSTAARFLSYISSVIARKSSLNGRRADASVVLPWSIFPNFIAETATGPIDFWDWAEGSWSYVMQLPDTPTECMEELLSYAMASTQLQAHDIKVLGINAMPIVELSEVIQDVSAIAGRQLDVTLVSDELRRLSDTLRLQSYVDGATAPVHRNFLIGPELRLKASQMSSSRIVGNAFETIELVNRMRRSVSGAASERQVAQHLMERLSA